MDINSCITSKTMSSLCVLACGVGVETTMFCVAKIVLLSCLISPTEVLKSMLNSETGMI